ncbi:MAG: hypothetical protein V4623_03125 [Pseudomonadota bacterium]
MFPEKPSEMSVEAIFRFMQAFQGLNTGPTAESGPRRLKPKILPTNPCHATLTSPLGTKQKPDSNNPIDFALDLVNAAIVIADMPIQDFEDLLKRDPSMLRIKYRKDNPLSELQLNLVQDKLMFSEPYEHWKNPDLPPDERILECRLSRLALQPNLSGRGLAGSKEWTPEQRVTAELQMDLAHRAHQIVNRLSPEKIQAECDEARMRYGVVFTPDTLREFFKPQNLLPGAEVVQLPGSLPAKQWGGGSADGNRHAQHQPPTKLTREQLAPPDRQATPVRIKPSPRQDQGSIDLSKKRYTDDELKQSLDNSAGIQRFLFSYDTLPSPAQISMLWEYGFGLVLNAEEMNEGVADHTKHIFESVKS